MISTLKKKFDWQTKYKVKRKLNVLKAFFVSNNLTKLAKIFKTDKWGGHFYTPHYPVSYTHLDVYKRQQLHRKIFSYN